MSKKKQKTITERCIYEVLRRGEATISQVLGVVGKYISSAQAVSRAKAKLACKTDVNLKSGHYTPHVLSHIGRRTIVCALLARAVEEGELRRTAPGVYAAPLPKVYQPPQVG